MKIEKLLEDYKVEAFRNAVRLFKDSILLYLNSSYPSSCSLAIASYEEIGKMHMIDRLCDQICMCPEGSYDIYKTFIKSGLIKNHKLKQSRAMFDANELVAEKIITPSVVNSGTLEQIRKQALYVELSNQVILTPSRISPKKTFQLIKLCHSAFHGSGDLAFSGFTASSTSKSQWLATRELNEVDSAFNKCKEHNNGIGLNTKG